MSRVASFLRWIPFYAWRQRAIAAESDIEALQMQAERMWRKIGELQREKRTLRERIELDDRILRMGVPELEAELNNLRRAIILERDAADELTAKLTEIVDKTILASMDAEDAGVTL